MKELTLFGQPYQFHETAELGIIIQLIEQKAAQVEADQRGLSRDKKLVLLLMEFARMVLEHKNFQQEWARKLPQLEYLCASIDLATQEAKSSLPAERA
jgi:hypothetical protein